MLNNKQSKMQLVLAMAIYVSDCTDARSVFGIWSFIAVTNLRQIHKEEQV